MQPSDADVDHQLRRPPEILGGQQASRATGRSDVPAATTTTRPPAGAGGSAGQASRRLSGS